MSNFFISLIITYRRLGKLLGLRSSCRFIPTCSKYTESAICRHGIIRGIALGTKRILKCHPWSKGGYDPII